MTINRGRAEKAVICQDRVQPWNRGNRATVSCVGGAFMRCCV